MAKRYGSQTPSHSVFLIDDETDTTEYCKAIELYNGTGNTAIEWQVELSKHMLAKNDEGLWTHTKVGYSVPRRNGKSELLIIRILDGFDNGEKILYTAHRTTTSHSFFERVGACLDALGYIKQSDARKEDNTPIELQYASYKANGLESIRLLKNGAVVNFRTRTSKGGLGEGYDTLIIDEAQEYQDDQESSLKYVVSDSKNPQTIMCGTPPTAVSSGTVFVKMRDNSLEGKAKHTMWAEWSVDSVSDVNDVDSWYNTNPSLGFILTERAIEDEFGDDETDFNIQRLGLWIKYNQKSAITAEEWKELELGAKPSVSAKYIGVKFGKDGKNVSMSIATKQDDGRIFVECLYIRPISQNVTWIFDVLCKINYEECVIDGKAGQELLEKRLKELRLKNIKFPTVSEVIQANASFEQAIFNGELCHANQQTVTDVVTNCKKRNIGNAGGFGYESIIDEFDISIMDSIIFAFWSCQNGKTRKVQRVNY